MLKISDIGNENDISAYEDAYGKKYLKIRLSDDRTFQTFARNNEDNREEQFLMLERIRNQITELRKEEERRYTYEAEFSFSKELPVQYSEWMNTIWDISNRDKIKNLSSFRGGRIL